MAATGIPLLESSVNKTPNDPVARFHLGMAYMQTGDYDKAMAALSKALSLKADFDGAAEARKTLSSIGA
jgi:cytochrome c-type biogenesis protein CcmH/NrfG